MSTANLNAKNSEDEKLWEAYNNLLISKDIGRLQKLNIRYDILEKRSTFLVVLLSAGIQRCRPDALVEAFKNFCPS